MKKELRKKLKSKTNLTCENTTNINIINNIKKVISEKLDILIYYPIKNEVNILDLINDTNKNFYLPYVINDLDMEIRKLDNLDNLVKDYCNIPSTNNKTTNKLDCVISPAIACNIKGYRLGYGKGYYDRFLNEKKDILKIIVCLDEFIIDEDFEEIHDQVYDIIVTEKRIIEVKK